MFAVSFAYTLSSDILLTAAVAVVAPRRGGI
jgi:hypothetical protein